MTWLHVRSTTPPPLSKSLDFTTIYCSHCNSVYSIALNRCFIPFPRHCTGYMHTEVLGTAFLNAINMWCILEHRLLLYFRVILVIHTAFAISAGSQRATRGHTRNSPEESVVKEEVARDGILRGLSAFHLTAQPVLLLSQFLLPLLPIFLDLTPFYQCPPHPGYFCGLPSYGGIIYFLLTYYRALEEASILLEAR